MYVRGYTRLLIGHMVSGASLSPGTKAQLQAEVGLREFRQEIEGRFSGAVVFNSALRVGETCGTSVGLYVRSWSQAEINAKTILGGPVRNIHSSEV